MSRFVLFFALQQALTSQTFLATEVAGSSLHLNTQIHKKIQSHQVRASVLMGRVEAVGVLPRATHTSVNDDKNGL